MSTNGTILATGPDGVTTTYPGPDVEADDAVTTVPEPGVRWYDRPEPVTFTRACAYGQSGFFCDGYTSDGDVCACPCHSFWNGRDNLADFHAAHNADVSRRFPPHASKS